MPGLLAIASLALLAGRDDETFVLRAARVLPVTAPPIDNGAILVRNGKIQAVGRAIDIKVPDGVRVIECPGSWVFPGLVDLHHHIEAGGGDINDMVHPLNAEYRTFDVVRPDNPYLKESLSGGVTAALFIPGSGTNIGGFGALCKMAAKDRESVVIRRLGGMKVAQAYNPERDSGDMGSTRMGMSWNLYRLLARARTYAEEWQRFQSGKSPSKPQLRPELENLRALFERKCPVLIHTAGARDVVATARMFHDTHGLWMILSHGCFDAWRAAAVLAEKGIPVNLGPRNYQFTNEGRFEGVPASYWQQGCRDLSLNTDAPVVVPEELFLQGTMAVRLGLPWEAALQALTIAPARQVGVGDRIGSLEPGKDADFVVKAGEPLDPASPVELVFIDGRVVYRKGDVP